MTLAYVFWHWPAQRDHYEERMQAFHDALGRPGSATFRLDVAPFDEPEPPFEDWYPVADWADVGRLNDEAVSGARTAPHDAVAHASRKGAGGIYRLIEGEAALADVTFAAWTSTRPSATPGAAVWQRQLVLGPAPEYAVLGASPVDVPDGAVLTRPRRVAGASE
ncbi:MAG: hypothetical protein M3389_02960 [Actinomycetota bacterium]|nr:hypothetical protein [Actinomycetota bacterium]